MHDRWLQPSSSLLTLAEGLVRLGLELPGEVQDRLDAYAALLARWNKTYNLTALRENSQIMAYHLLDSLAVLPIVDRLASGRPDGLKILDVGSGGGLPGIPWAVARPGWAVSLIDSNQKKTAFLQQAVIELKLENVEVCRGRVEQLDVQGAGRSFQVITSRAFAALDEFVRLTRPLLAENGCWLAMKGQFPQVEIAALPSDVGIAAVEELTVPAVEGARHIIEMRLKENIVRDGEDGENGGKRRI